MERAPVVVLLLLVSAAPAGAQSGGTVDNVLPSVISFEHSGGDAFVVGDADSFRAVVSDSNGEGDIVSVRLNSSTAADVEDTRAITSEDLDRRDEPPAFVAGWKVWNPDPRDGLLNVSVRHVYVAPGSYEWWLSVRDEGEYAHASGTLARNVTSAPGSGGGGGGGSGGPPNPPPPAEDPDGIGQTARSSAVEHSMGLQSQSLAGAADLTWPRAPDARGYTLWWSDGDGWSQLVDVGADAIGFLHQDAPPGLTYKIAAVYGAFPAPSDDPASHVDGWDAGLFRTGDPRDVGGALGQESPDPTDDDVESTGPLFGLWLTATGLVAGWGLLLRVRRPGARS